MAAITQFKGYQPGKPPTIPKPEKPVDPMIVTVQDGVPVAYPGCHGLGFRHRLWDGPGGKLLAGVDGPFRESVGSLCKGCVIAVIQTIAVWFLLVFFGQARTFVL